MSLTHIDWMVTFLAVMVIGIGLSFWRAQRDPSFNFDAFDLIMEGGRVSKIAVAFMLVLAVTTWVIIDMQIKGTLTEGMFGLYGGMWVLPLVAKVVFNKTEMPGNTTITSLTESRTTVVKDPLP